MTDNYISVRHWGLFPDVPEDPKKEDKPKPKLESQFKEGYEAAFGLHLLEGVN